MSVKKCEAEHRPVSGFKLDCKLTLLTYGLNGCIAGLILE